jgi:hypothetical protein
MRGGCACGVAAELTNLNPNLNRMWGCGRADLLPREMHGGVCGCACCFFNGRVWGPSRCSSRTRIPNPESRNPAC